jgi:hypothetical protein
VGEGQVKGVEAAEAAEGAEGAVGALDRLVSALGHKRTFRP